MILKKRKRCTFENCLRIPVYNIPSETRGVFCLEHKSENIIDVKSKRCSFENCLRRPTFNLPSETRGAFCSEHKSKNMVNVKGKRCGFFGEEKEGQPKCCRKSAFYGYSGKRAERCDVHCEKGMINVLLEAKCSILDCEREYVYVVDDEKFCGEHCPDSTNFEICIKRLCKFCDLQSASYVCPTCVQVQNKKEWGIVRHLRKHIDTKFEYNSSKMLQGCSRKRPDIFFDLPQHCVIVEVDEHQHATYEDSCECARISEIVGAIGGRPVTLVRFNPDSFLWNNETCKIPLNIRVELLIQVIKEQLNRVPQTFAVTLLKLFFDGIGESQITDLQQNQQNEFMNNNPSLRLRQYVLEEDITA